MSKLWLIIYHPFQRLDGGSSLPQEVRDKLFSTSLENCEYSVLLENEEKTKRWGWLFRTYTQWHAIAFMLSELTVRTTGPEVDRAWKVIDYMIGRRWHDDHQADAQSSKLKSHLWKPLRRLMDRAKKAHEEALKKQEQENLAAGAMPELDRTSSIMNMDLSVDRLFPDLPKGAENIGFGATQGSTPDYNALSNGMMTPADTTSPMQQTLPATTGTNILNTNPLAMPGGSGGNAVAFLAMTNNNDWLTNGAFDPAQLADFGGGTGTSDSPLLPDGSVNWPSWDSMVAQYGMDIDENQINTGQPYPYGSTFSSLTQWY